MPTIFVYGTLKRGDCRHDALRDQTFLGATTTAESYRMFNLGSYPGLVAVPADQAGRGISGELYEVDDATLKQLDLIEGVAEGLYHRASIRLEEPRQHHSVESYFYLQSVVGFPEITNWSVTGPQQHITETRSER